MTLFKIALRILAILIVAHLAVFVFAGALIIVSHAVMFFIIAIFVRAACKH